MGTEMAVAFSFQQKYHGLGGVYRNCFFLDSPGVGLSTREKWTVVPVSKMLDSHTALK